jgi:LruC domain-containing protein
LAGETPTNLANLGLFGTGDDNSVMATGQTYLSKNGGFPWAIHIPDSFEYPIEKVDINSAYLKFAEWAESGGLLHNDWYMNLQGYRVPLNIYKKK